MYLPFSFAICFTYIVLFVLCMSVAGMYYDVSIWWVIIIKKLSTLSAISNSALETRKGRYSLLKITSFIEAHFLVKTLVQTFAGSI